MKTRKLFSIMTAALMGITVLPTTSVTAFAADSTTINQAEGDLNHYQSQLNTQEQAIYNALETMNKTGLFLSGKGSLDLLKNGISVEEANAYMNGDATLAKSFQNARDAYMSDNPALFYVDFSKVTLRAGTKDGRVALELGTGNNANYYKAGFTSANQVSTAVTSFNKNFATLVTNARKKEAGIEQIRSIHTQIINKANYTKTGNFVTGGYGVFSGKANCEGYATLFKAAMDDLGYESIVVVGTAINSKNETELHMWNYVKLEGQWYAVDTTWDDPIGGRLQETYFMQGRESFNKNHYASNVFSEDGKEFDVPELSNIGYGEESGIQESNPEGFFVKTYKGEYSEGYDYTVFNVSYKGQGVTNLEANGEIMAMRYAAEGEEYGVWTPVVLFSQDSKNGDYSTFALSNAGHVQFAITKLPFPMVPKFSQDLSEAKYNVGLSEEINIDYVNEYVPEPFLRTSTPSVTKTIKPVQQDFKVQFDEKMELIDPNAPVTIEIETSEEKLVYDISNINWDTGKASLYDGTEIDVTNVSFNFTPDKTYQGNENVYTFRVKNLKGVKSGKEAKEFTYRTAMDAIAPCKYNKTNLLFSVVNINKVADYEMNLSNYTLPNIKTSTNVILVAKKDDGTAASYDLSFNCSELMKFMVPGTKLVLGVPYPKGFDSRSENVTYTASRYVKNSDGQYVEQIVDVKITDKGIELTSNL